MSAVASTAAASVCAEPNISCSAQTERRSDPVAQAERLRTTVETQLADVVDGPVSPGDVYVGWVAALEAASCPARYRASGADGWGFPGWSAPLAAGAVGRAALAEHLRATAQPVHADDAAAPLPHPVEAVRAWLRIAARAPTSPVAEWIGELHRSGDRATIAAVAASASRWLAGFVRVVGWPLPDRLGLVVDDPEGPHTRRWSRRWRPRPGSPSASQPAKQKRPRITVASSPDAVVGKVTPSGDFDLLVHRPFSPGEGALADRAAFEAAAGALSSGIVPRHVVVSTADTGEHVRCPIDEPLLDRGAELVVEVVRQRTIAADDGWTLDDGTPSSACRHCPVHADCSPGQTWLTGPGRWRGGLPTLSVGP
jgi:hypothetical protein